MYFHFTFFGYKAVRPYELINKAEIMSLGNAASRKIMKGCRNAFDFCALVVILLDGTQVDDSTAWELGYAFAKGIPAVGIRTDARYSGETPGIRSTQ